MADQNDIVKQRIRDILHIKKCSIRAVSANDTEQRRLNNQINGVSQVSAETLQIILAKFPDVNPGWLLTGSGARTLPGAPAITAQQIHGDNTGSTFNAPVSFNRKRGHPKLANCEEELEEMTAMYDSLQTKYNALREEHSELQNKLRLMADKYIALLENNNKKSDN
jgi:hypothetical protein